MIVVRGHRQSESAQKVRRVLELIVFSCGDEVLKVFEVS